MSRFQNIPIRRKFAVAIISTTAIALVLVYAAIMTYELVRYRRAAIRDFSTQAEILGASSSAALAFGDDHAASDALSALRARHEIVQAFLFDADGRIAADYRTQAQPPPPTPQSDGYRFEGRHLIVFRTVKLGNDSVGTIVLRADLREERRRLLSYAAIALAVMLAALIVALLLSTKLQRQCIEPVLDLARLAREVTGSHNYSLRATAHSRDEIGVLTEGFNQMLAQIQKRGDGLTKAKEELDQFFTLSLDMLCIAGFDGYFKRLNPAWEHTLGYSLAELQAEPYVRFVHPDDCESTTAEAQKLAVGGQTISFENRYRCKDGDYRSLLWNAISLPGQHLIYAAAHDVTDRRRLEKEVLDVADREQARLGQELHDGLCQHLVGTAFSCNLLSHKLHAQAVPEAGVALAIARSLDEAITQARGLARGLYPVRLETDGLASALEELADNVTERFGIPCAVERADPATIADNPTATHLYRIAQEAVLNAIKHSHAKRIVIRLSAQNGKVAVEVTDDGVGIRATAPGAAGMGLHIMHYRADLIGGTLAIQPAPERGTVVVCSINQNGTTNRTTHGKDKNPAR